VECYVSQVSAAQESPTMTGILAGPGSLSTLVVPLSTRHEFGVERQDRWRGSPLKGSSGAGLVESKAFDSLGRAVLQALPGPGVRGMLCCFSSGEEE
jgi:hypothetical protein